ncbi:MAG: hypothetical protein HOE90_21275 [Bacteriovoracaceae bacterium]|nr:hypothetical protein [Bacteriovoracaceae bacterium]
MNKFLIYGILMISILYGVTMQQFRHYDHTDPRGVEDSLSYLKMALGDYNVTVTHKYRFIIPGLVRATQKTLGVEANVKNFQTIYYFWNFGVGLLALLFLFLFLRELGFEEVYCLVGTFLLSSSRIFILSIGTPLVDSLYFFGISFISYMTISHRYKTLMFSLPIIVCFKESILPFFAIPVIEMFIRKEKKSLVLFITATLVSLVFLMLVRGLIVGEGVAGASGTFIGVIIHFLGYIPGVLKYLFSFKGVHDLSNGLLLSYLLVGYGIFLTIKKKATISIPACIWIQLPITSLFVLMGFIGNSGRHFFGAFPLFIALSLITIRHSVGFAKKSA